MGWGLALFEHIIHAQKAKLNRYEKVRSEKHLCCLRFPPASRPLPTEKAACICLMSASEDPEFHLQVKRGHAWGPSSRDGQICCGENDGRGTRPEAARGHRQERSD